jgi:hypothetical protein
MAKKEQTDRVDITRMANGYMVRRAHDYRSGDAMCLQECYVFNDFGEAATKALDLLGDASE